MVMDSILADVSASVNNEVLKASAWYGLTLGVIERTIDRLAKLRQHVANCESPLFGLWEPAELLRVQIAAESLLCELQAAPPMLNDVV